MSLFDQVTSLVSRSMAATQGAGLTGGPAAINSRATGLPTGAEAGRGTTDQDRLAAVSPPRNGDPVDARPGQSTLTAGGIKWPVVALLAVVVLGLAMLFGGRRRKG